MSENKDLNKNFNVSTEGSPSPLPAKSNFIRFMDGCPPPIAVKRANSNANSSSTQQQKPSEKSKDKQWENFCIKIQI